MRFTRTMQMMLAGAGFVAAAGMMAAVTPQVNAGTLYGVNSYLMYKFDLANQSYTQISSDPFNQGSVSNRYVAQGLTAAPTRDTADISSSTSLWGVASYADPNTTGQTDLVLLEYDPNGSGTTMGKAAYFITPSQLPSGFDVTGNAISALTYSAADNAFYVMSNPYTGHILKIDAATLTPTAWGESYISPSFQNLVYNPSDGQLYSATVGYPNNWLYKYDTSDITGSISGAAATVSNTHTTDDGMAGAGMALDSNGNLYSQDGSQKMIKYSLATNTPTTLFQGPSVSGLAYYEVPEPASAALLLVGLGALVMIPRRKRNVTSF